MSPEILTEFGNGLRHGFHFGNEVADPPASFILHTDGFLNFFQFIFSLAVSVRLFIISSLVIILVLCDTGVFINGLLNNVCDGGQFFREPLCLCIQLFRTAEAALYILQIGDHLPADRQYFVQCSDESGFDFILRKVRRFAPGFIFELAVALPYGFSVFRIIAVPNFWTVYLSAFSAE